MIKKIDTGIASSVFMVSGCVMGAGTLALPMVASGPYSTLAICSIIIIGLISYLIASLSLNIYILHAKSINISNLANKYFGRFGFIFSMLLNYSLLVTGLTVYILCGGDSLLKLSEFLVDYLITNNHFYIFGQDTLYGIRHFIISQDNKFYFSILFVAIFTPIFLGGKKRIISYNNIIFLLKITSFLVAIVFGFKFITSSLFNVSVDYFQYLPAAIPVLFLAAGFHILVPVIADINHYNKKRCNKIFAYGVLLPLILYIAWVLVMFSIIPRGEIITENSASITHGISINNNINQLNFNPQVINHDISFASLIHNKASINDMLETISLNANISKYMFWGVMIFASIAVLTSFLSFGISIYEYLRDSLKIRQDKQIYRLFNVFLTFTPSLIIACVNPNEFLFILQQLSIILILTTLIPIICYVKQLFIDKNIISNIGIHHSQISLVSSKVISSGDISTHLFMSIIILAFSVMMIGIQILNNLGLIANFGA